MRGRTDVVLGVCLIAIVALALPVLADDWVERDSHHNDPDPPVEYHVHAHAKAYAYTGGDLLCHYNQWQHDYGDSWANYPFSYQMTYWHNDEWGWTRTDIYKESVPGSWDYAQVTLPDYRYCPA